jgi:hypothetical protein
MSLHETLLRDSRSSREDFFHRSDTIVRDDWDRTWWIQADRGGRPLQAVCLVGEQREAYLSGAPANDDRFVCAFAHELEHSGAYSPEDAKAVARKLLPDILFYDPRQPARYPDNGRMLTDDVVDAFFSMYTKRNVTDKVGPHRDLLQEFPYLGLPNDWRLDADF